MNTGKNLLLGIDIGGTNTVIGFVTEEGDILERRILSTQAFSSAEELIHAVKHEINQYALLHTGEAPPFAAGIGAPNASSLKGTVEFPANLKWRGVIPFRNLFEKLTGIPCSLTNDANAAALGEMYFGAGKGMKDIMFITLGTGLGSGIIVNGELVQGHDGFAGEIGHTIIIQHGRMCGCGRRGCLEQYCSANGLIKTYLEILKTADQNAYEKYLSEPPSSQLIYDKAMGGDEAAFYAFNYTGELLGFALANSVAYTSPECIFIGGGLAEAGELILNPTILSFEKNLLNVYKNKIAIRTSALDAGDAHLLGASFYAMKQIKNKII